MLIVECDWCGSREEESAFHLSVFRYSVPLIRTTSDLGAIVLCQDCYEKFVMMRKNK